MCVFEEMMVVIIGFGFDICVFEGNVDFGVVVVYFNIDLNLMNNCFFGEGCEMVEMMIVEVVGEFVGVLGVVCVGFLVI